MADFFALSYNDVSRAFSFVEECEDERPAFGVDALPAYSRRGRDGVYRDIQNGTLTEDGYDGQRRSSLEDRLIARLDHAARAAKKRAISRLCAAAHTTKTAATRVRIFA